MNTSTVGVALIECTDIVIGATDWCIDTSIVNACVNSAEIVIVTCSTATFLRRNFVRREDTASARGYVLVHSFSNTAGVVVDVSRKVHIDPFAGVTAVAPESIGHLRHPTALMAIAHDGCRAVGNVKRTLAATGIYTRRVSRAVCVM